MWRNATSKTPRILSLYSKHRIHVSNRNQSSSSNQSGGGTGKVLLALVGTGTLGVGGAVVYAGYNRDFRRLLEDNLPYADTVFTYIPDWGSQKPKSEKPSTAVPPPDTVSLLKKKQERAASQKPEEKPIEKSKPQSSEGTSGTLAEKEKEVEAAKKKAQEDQQQKQKVLDLQNRQRHEENQNTALESRLNSCKDNLERISQDSLLSHQRAIEAIRNHAQALLKALDMEMDNSQEAWHEVHLAQEGKVSALTRATEAHLDTKSALESLEYEIKGGKESAVTSNNSALLTAEEALDRARKQVQETQTRLQESQNEFGFAQGYQKLIEEGQQQLQRELQDILPQYTQGKAMSVEDLNLLLVHAHQRILQIQKKLAKQQSLEQSRNDQVATRQKSEQDSLAKHQDELTRQRRDFELKLANQSSELRDDFETEMRQQLRRAAAAHADHLQEALATQRDELQRHHSLRCRDQLLEQQASVQATLSPFTSRLKSLESHLKAHEELQASSRSAQRLWLAAQSLRQCLVRHSRIETTGPLEERVQALRRAAAPAGQQGNGDDSAPEDPLYRVVLDTLPSEALSRGVYHEGALKDRFCRSVEPQCRRAALVDKDETEGSLYKHILSRLQSLLLVETVNSADIGSEDDPRGTYSILRSVRRCLAAGDLEGALVGANKLSGVPRRLASDWVREVRLHLEVRQAADALMAQAASINVQAQQ